VDKPFLNLQSKATICIVQVMGSYTSKPLSYFITPKQLEAKWFPEFVERLSATPVSSKKVLVITGTTSGTGLILARTCAAKQLVHAIVMLNRPSTRATKAENDIKACIPPGAECHVITIPCDLQSFASVREAANIIKSKYESIDVLINNAGVLALDDMATTDGYDVQMQTNHLSHFLLTKELYPLLKRAADQHGESRIVQHASTARHFAKFPEARYYEKPNEANCLGGNVKSQFFSSGSWVRYSQTKLANMIFAAALRDKCSGNVKSVACAPGLALTNMLDPTIANVGTIELLYMRLLAQSGEDGTMPLLTAAFGQDVENGDFYEPSGNGARTGLPRKFSLDEGNNKGPEWHTLLWKKSEEAIGEAFHLA
jgi:NAD(P)-dependent dehydrogenase (short-subunit alcohol dehydrogenase family)